MTPAMTLAAAALLACLTASVDGFSAPALLSFPKAHSFSRSAAAAGHAHVVPPCSRRSRLSPAMSGDAAAKTEPPASPFAGKKALIFTWYPAKRTQPSQSVVDFAAGSMLCPLRHRVRLPLAPEKRRDCRRACAISLGLECCSLLQAPLLDQALDADSCLNNTPNP